MSYPKRTARDRLKQSIPFHEHSVRTIVHEFADRIIEDEKRDGFQKRQDGFKSVHDVYPVKTENRLKVPISTVAGQTECQRYHPRRRRAVVILHHPAPENLQDLLLLRDRRKRTVGARQERQETKLRVTFTTTWPFRPLSSADGSDSSSSGKSSERIVSRNCRRRSLIASTRKSEGPV
jgi:hypothetical protein